jgi:hypothetical protein
LVRGEQLCGDLERSAPLKEALRAWCNARVPGA